MGSRGWRARSLATLVALSVSLAPSLARAGSLGHQQVLASPTFPSPVAASGGTIAWAAPSGRGHRFEIVIRREGTTRALRRTSAVGWIDGVKLGTARHGHRIVVYSRCPYSPFATADVGRAGSDGCRLWWVAIGGGNPQRIAAAPPDSTVGSASAGKVVFAVQPNTAHERQPARLERSTLTGHFARALSVPNADGAEITDVSVAAGAVAFIEQPRPANPHAGASRVWLDAPGAPPRLLAQQISDTAPLDDSARFFDGLTLTGGDVYAFLYTDIGIFPPAPSELERIRLAPAGATATAAWIAPLSLSSFGIQAAAFDASEQRLVLDLFSQEVDLSRPSGACSRRASSARACPILASGPISF